ncbi:MAG: hypothetical protein HOE53_02350 [Candidatus Magasanikbacteria bacterium]|jgi:hypothetical protein|nr:hypothetical protein [Candidatus Magasanikbacteria bacterium]
MDTSLLVARIAAVAYLSMAVGMSLSPGYYKQELGKMIENSAFKLLGGMMSLILGMLLVTNHNMWERDWTVLVTLLGWLALVKGVFLLAFPNSMGMFKGFLKAENIKKMVTPMCWILGLVFAYFGFVA